MQNGKLPSWHVSNFIRYHVWDWPPASAWLLANKVRDRNYQIMERALEGYVRKPLCMYDRVLGQLRADIYPWDLAIPQIDSSTEARSATRLT